MLDNELILYRCIDCGFEFGHKNSDGLCCPECMGKTLPIKNVTIGYCNEKGINYCKPWEKAIDCKKVLKQQIERLENLQKGIIDTNVSYSKSETVIMIAGEIRQLVDLARRIP